jgi:hypothetical protein
MYDSYIILYKIDGNSVSKEDALLDYCYYKEFLYGDTEVGKVEYYEEGILFRVVYPNRDEVDSGILVSHGIYGDVNFEIWTRKEDDGFGNIMFRSSLYDSSGIKLSTSDCIERDGLLIIETKLDNELSPVSVTEYLYDGIDLVEIVEYDTFGNRIGGMLINK